MKYAVIIKQEKKFTKVEFYDSKTLALHKYKAMCDKLLNGVVLFTKVKKEFTKYTKE